MNPERYKWIALSNTTAGPNEIDFGSRVYFNVPVPTAATYDVSIFSWSWVQTGNGADMR